MSTLRELSFNEVELVNGGGNNGQNASDRHYGGNNARTNYGGQGNGYQLNISAGITGANMANDLSSNCGLAMIGGSAGLIGAAVSKSITGAISAVTGIIAGCRPDSSSKSKSDSPFR